MAFPEATSTWVLPAGIAARVLGPSPGMAVGSGSAVGAENCAEFAEPTPFAAMSRPLSATAFPCRPLTTYPTPRRPSAVATTETAITTRFAVRRGRRWLRWPRLSVLGRSGGASRGAAVIATILANLGPWSGTQPPLAPVLPHKSPSWRTDVRFPGRFVAPPRTAGRPGALRVRRLDEVRPGPARPTRRSTRRATERAGARDTRRAGGHADASGRGRPPEGGPRTRRVSAPRGARPAADATHAPRSPRARGRLGRAASPRAGR